MIFNTSNFLLLIIVCVICYTFWAPYIRGKKTKAVVDGYVHPKEGKNCDLVWCYRLMYREQKAGKRLYCYTRKTYDTREEMRAKYPKGTILSIMCRIRTAMRWVLFWMIMMTERFSGCIH